jgi:glycosyltransferase involved in cell wall biosynthesis
MRLGLDLLFLEPGRSGGRETYSRELVRAMRAVRGDLHVTAFAGGDVAGTGWWTEVADRVVILPRARAASRVRWALGELVGLPRAAAGIEVLLGPANFAPLHGPFARVLTLHDLMYRVVPGAVTPGVRLATDAMLVPAARRAHRVLTGAEAAREQIVAELGLPAERIDVVPHGLGTPPAGGDRDRGRALVAGGDRRVAFAVATDLPHKDHDTLVRAVASLPPAERPLLAIAGRGTDGARLVALAAGLGATGDVRLLGGVGAAELEDLYAAADVFATATRSEGFGLGVLEAMARGVPVVCSDLPVLREVGGAQARYVPIGDAPAWGAALRDLAAGGPAVAETVRAGRERAAAFTWDRAARGTLASLERGLASFRAGRR